MAVWIFLFAALLIINVNLASSTGLVIENQVLTDHQANALEVGFKPSPFVSLLEYLMGNWKIISKEYLDPAQSSKTSIQYLLYTPEDPDTGCYLEPNLDALKRCHFDSSYPMKFLIHGFLSSIHPGGSFMMIKDEMLKIYKYNVIALDWSPFNRPPYTQAVANTLAVGQELANFILFLQKYADVDIKNIHLIGHSLGAHLAGVAGAKIPNLGRITGLDPASRFFLSNAPLHRLSYKDADFVDVIHSSNHVQGFGEEKPLGDQDFYPNGGITQPQCQKEAKSTSFLSKRICNHSSAISYFLQSVNSNNCKFLASMCGSYSDFKKGLCSDKSSPMAEMGLPAKPIPGLPPQSEFFLRTSPSHPYCLQDGYESI